MKSNGVFARLVEEFRRLPGIGQKTAQRLAFFVLKLPEQNAQSLAQAILDVKSRLRFCKLCQNVAEEALCEICRDPLRDRSRVLVVKELSTLYAVERTGEYKGLYHVLLGTPSPLDDRADGQTWMALVDVKARELVARLQEGGGPEEPPVQEVILATDPTMEGEAMALYLTKVLKPLGLRISRIALGIPVGVDLEYADEVTLIKSLEGRREV